MVYSPKKPHTEKPYTGNRTLLNTDSTKEEENTITPEQAKENRKRLEAMIRPIAKQKTVKQFSQDIAREKALRQLSLIKEKPE